MNIDDTNLVGGEGALRHGDAEDHAGPASLVPEAALPLRPRRTVLVRVAQN